MSRGRQPSELCDRVVPCRWFRPGVSSHSGRRTFASRLIAQGHSIETVQLLLGHVHLDHVAPYLEISKKARCEAMADLGGFFADA
ncbi:tyrosine-type recombinase/integrase [Burkholderia contaminans]|nr:tyrosine-type recombinase/integrase [Burkholderia contaminans]